MADAPAVVQREGLVLAGPITTATLGAIREYLLQHLEDPGTFLLHAHEVTELDAEGAQLIGAFVNAVTRRAARVRWVTVSPHLLAAARALGMEFWMGLSEGPPPWQR